MNPASFSILGTGSLVAVLLIYFVAPRFIVTGPDRRRLQDIPRLDLIMKIVIFSAIVLLLVAGVLNMNLDLVAFPLAILIGLLFMFMEKKYLPDTRRHLVTLCWIGSLCVVFGIYAGVTYF
ncbi:DUF4181 domain-containing protein [Saccharibacillus sacchari]|uniref:DUF4181 domain-containing protein n=1 Tax=Saccharibacillus sacchari TaxID=456493 RepID=A0ACC6PJY1_9BACL